VAVTAAELGYANPSAFSRVFTQRHGLSPRAWLAHRPEVGGSTVPVLEGTLRLG
jgi:AraC-like DNA-binding protein